MDEKKIKKSKGKTPMNEKTTHEYFRLIKQCIECQLDRHPRKWSANDSLLLDWAIYNLEMSK